MNMKRRFAVFALSTVLVSTAAPLAALAGTRSLWPNQFTAVWDTSLAFPGFDVLGAASASAFYDGEVKLPIGATITQFMVNAGTAVNSAATATFYRKKLDGPAEQIVYLHVPGDSSWGWYKAPSINPNFARVAAGYKYWVRLAISTGSGVQGVRVSFR